MKKIFVMTICLLSLMTFSTSAASTHFNCNTVDSPPDSLFVVNDKDDWQLVLTYITQTDFLINFEILLQRNNALEVDWEKPALIGRLDKDYRPFIRKDFLIVHPNRTWKLIIAENGKCFLQLVQGKKPEKKAAVVFPIQVKYSK